MEYQFKTINLVKDFETCVSFRKDSHYISFNSYDDFDSMMGSYKSRMADRIRDLPNGNCHLWHGKEIVGQTEMKLIENSDIGYINLFYLTKEHRGKGIGNLLQKRSIEVFSKLGTASMQLSVSVTNSKALQFYSNNGWHNQGLRPGKEEMFLMGYDLK